MPPPPNTVALGVRISTYELGWGGGGTDIQYVVETKEIGDPIPPTVVSYFS